MSDSYLKRLVESFEARTDKISMRIVGDDSQIYTFGDSLRQIRAIAHRLEREGVGFGDRVAVIGENHPCWAIAYLGILYRGAVCVPVDPHGEIATLTNFIENSDAKVVFIGKEVEEKFREMETKLGRKVPAVIWSSSSPSTAGDNTDFSNWAATSFPESFAREIPKASGDDIALLIYTSGTTGTPKGVPLTHANILAELDGVNYVLKLTEKDRMLSLLPLFHVYLQIVNLWVATTYGIEVGYLKELSPAELGDAMKQFKPTVLTTVPRLWYLFHKKIFDAVEDKPKLVRALFGGMLAANGAIRNAIGVNLGPKLFGKVHESFGGRLRVAISAGSRFDENVATDFHKLGFSIIQGYGLTETSGAATATYETDNKVGSVGKAFKGAEIKIDNPDKDGVGEVLIKGGMVFSGYYKNPEATAEAFTDDGWFRSGDLGKFDDEGHLYIVGRAKDVIVLPSGKNVHPEDLEIHYLKTPLVEEMAVIGVRDENAQHSGAEKLAAIVVPDFEYLKQSKVANSKEAIRYALDNLGRDLPEYQRVRDYIIRAEPLPRTGSRKIKRFELKKELESGVTNGHANDEKDWELSAEDQAYLESPIAKTVVSIIKANTVDVDVIHPSMNLEIDLGLDSLARAEAFAATEHAFSTEFSGDAAAEALTVRDVIELVTKNSPLTESQLDTVSADDAEFSWSTILSTANDESQIPELHKALDNRPVFLAIAFTAYKFFNLFCRVFMQLEVHGIENLRSMKRPFLICPNHQSFLDPFVLCSSYPFEFFKNTFHVGASEFFQSRLMGWIAQMLHVVPVDPDTQLMKAMKASAIGLKRGRILNIYPEGERAYDGNLHKFKKGAAILATELDLPIVPVAIDGLHKVWARRSWRIRPAKVKIKIGAPFYAKDVLGRQLSDANEEKTSGLAENGEQRQTNNEQTYEEVTAHLKERIEQMIDELRSS